MENMEPKSPYQDEEPYARACVRMRVYIHTRKSANFRRGGELPPLAPGYANATHSYHIFRHQGLSISLD